MRLTEYIQAVKNGVQGDDALQYTHIDIQALWPEIKIVRAQNRKHARNVAKGQGLLF